MKRILFLLLLLNSLFWACQREGTEKPSIQQFEGETMGTYYRVTYIGEKQNTLPQTIDRFLIDFNNEVSTYIPNSTISRFNRGVAWDSLRLNSPINHFIGNLRKANEVYQVTQGFFDPTVMPLVNYWGFGYTPKRAVTQVDSVVIDSIMEYVGFDQITITATEDSFYLGRDHPEVQLDFSAIAKGYAIDQIAERLIDAGISSFLIDIGGEARTRGDKGSLGPWRLGIAVPQPEAAQTEYQVAVPLVDRAIATSGNYRNYHDVDGQIYGHTINPFTGYPELSRLLSASVLAPDCATADAYATACMVSGLESAYTMIDTLATLEAYFIYANEAGELQTKATPGFSQLLEQAH